MGFLKDLELLFKKFQTYARGILKTFWKICRKLAEIKNLRKFSSNFKEILKKFKKSLAQKVCQKSNIPERWSKVWRRLRLLCLRHCRWVTVQTVRLGERWDAACWGALKRLTENFCEIINLNAPAKVGTQGELTHFLRRVTSWQSEVLPQISHWSRQFPARTAQKKWCRIIIYIQECTMIQG